MVRATLWFLHQPMGAPSPGRSQGRFPSGPRHLYFGVPGRFVLTNYLSAHGKPPRLQWLAAAEGTCVAMLVAHFCGTFLPFKKCDLKPTTLQEYLGIWCDSVTATFRVPQGRLDKMRARIEEALGPRSVSFSTLQSVAGQVAVPVRPASLYTQGMFATISALEKSGQSVVEISSDSSTDLRGEMWR